MTSDQSSQKRPNQLINEKSPYLLQHAYNPVDWHPWGEEAFSKALEEDKPIFLSIGYSTCHWCHVMEAESFEDEEVAKLMNENLVAIKVDREERPDIDSVYMEVCQRMTGSGGWPLNIIMTPDKKPFFAATYIPKEGRFTGMGMLELVPRIRQIWTDQREDIEKQAEEIISSFEETKKGGVGEEITEELLHETYDLLFMRFDEQNAGFGGAPKFPTPHNLTFLLRYWKRSGEKQALEMVERTLQQMRLGGMYDHIGFGFHRYSTDSRWLVPHFEKMLYDQAMLIIAYTESYQATGKKEYERTAREIITYVLLDMKDPDGGFYSAQDADSEGVEGKFYLWTRDEIIDTLSAEEAELVMEVYNIKSEGNFSEEATGRMGGSNIPHLKRTIPELAGTLDMKPEKLEEKLDAIRQKLFEKREERIHPGRDDKVLTDWNGLMIAALSKASRVFDEPMYEKAARDAADFILHRMYGEKGRLYHRYRDGEVAVPAFLDDYATLIWGLIELYETTFDEYYLGKALELNSELMEHFWDSENGGFHLTADDSEELMLRRKEIYDGAIPSGNSISVSNLLRLSRITADPDMEKRAWDISKAFSDTFVHMPAAYTHLMGALDLSFGPSSEVVIVGDMESADTKNMVQALRKDFIPNKVVVFKPAEVTSPDIVKMAGYTKNLSSIDGKATAYVCKNHTCKLPTTDPEEMLKLLEDRETDR